MKKLILLSMIFFCSLSYGQNFPGSNVELLNGKQLKIKESESAKKYGFRDFYKDSSMKIGENYCNKGRLSTPYDSLAGKVFKLIDLERYINSIGNVKYKMKIENPTTGIIYFDYDPSYEFKFPFEVIGGLNYPEGFFCKEIEMNSDKFTGETKITSPMKGIFFTKVKKGTESHTYLFLRTPGHTANVNIKGVIILLENGLKIEKPDAKIDVEVGEGNYLYSTLFELSEKDIQLLVANKMTDYRLYVYDNTVRNGNTLKEYLKCISKM